MTRLITHTMEAASVAAEGITAPGGAIEFDLLTDRVYSGTKSLKGKGVSGFAWDTTSLSMVSGRDYYFNFVWQIDTLPSAGNIAFLFGSNATGGTGGDYWVVQIAPTTGALQLEVTGTNVLNANMATIAVDTWYRTEVRVRWNSGGNDELEVRHGPASGYTAAKVQQTISGAYFTSAVNFLFYDNTGGTSAQWYDEVYVNDNQGAAPDNTWATAFTGVELVSVGTGAAGALTPTAPGLPDSLLTDDILIYFFSQRGSATHTTPTNWNLLHSGQAGSGSSFNRTSVYWRFYSAGVTIPAVVSSINNVAWLARVAAFRNVDTTTPIDASSTVQANAALQPVAVPGLTTVTNNAMVVGWGSKNDDNAAGGAGYSSPGTMYALLANEAGIVWTEAYEGQTGAGSDMSHAADFGIKPTAGAVAAKSFTVTGGVTAISASGMFSLKQKASGTTNPEAGTGRSDFVASGADTFTASETGSGVLLPAAAGANETQLSKAGSGISVLSAKGADVVNFVETGSGISPFAASGAYTVSKIYLRTNIGVSSFVASAADAVTFAESGAGISILVSQGADISTFFESGTGITARAGQGADAGTFIESGSGITVATSSGVSSETYSEDGKAISVFTVDSTSVLVYSDTATGVSVFIAKGSDAVIYSDSGTGLSIFGSSGSDVATYSEAGTALTGFASTGASVEAYSEDGKALSVFTSDSTSVLVYSDTGTGATVFVAAGSDSVTYSDSGTGLTVFSSSGADVVTFVEQGTGFTDRVASGIATALRQKANTAVSDFLAQGESTSTSTETGTGVSQFGGSGDSELVGFGPFEYEKDGTAFASFTAKGADVAEFTEDGTGFVQLYGSAAIQKIYQQIATALSVRAAAGTDYVQRTRTGTGLSEFAATGDSETDRQPVTFEKTGAGASNFTAKGADVAEFDRSGTGVIDNFFGGEYIEIVVPEQEESGGFGGGRGTPFVATGGPLTETVTKEFPAEITLFRSATGIVSASIPLKRVATSQFSANIQLQRSKQQTFNLERQPAEHYLNLRREDEEIITILYDC